jgi:predicted ArsR family transcriptional regulator
MTKLSDTQAVILSAASQRENGAVLPLPEDLKIAGGAVNRVLRSLNAKGLIEHQGAQRGDVPPPLRITRAGLEAIGIEPEDAEAFADTASASKAGTARAVPAKTVSARTATKSKGKAKVKPGKTTPSETPAPRVGTKQAQMIELLKRPEGATVAQIAAATGWQHHTIRGAISGALKKKLKLNVEATRTREVGPNKTGAKGSSTVYRIVG